MTHVLKPGEAVPLNEDHIIFELFDLLSPHHTVIVRAYLLGQYRVQLTDKRKSDPDAVSGHGEIVRELCTYSWETLMGTVLELHACIDPEAYCASLAKPWNCEYSGGRIRLDNRPEDRP